MKMLYRIVKPLLGKGKIRIKGGEWREMMFGGIRRKTAYSLTITILLIGVLMSAVKIQPVKAGTDIYILPDGSIYPPTPAIRREGDKYTFFATIYDLTIIVQRSNIVIDGNKSVIGTTINITEIFRDGFDIEGVNNVTVMNSKIVGGNKAVFGNYTTQIEIRGNDMIDGGISLRNSVNCSVVGNSLLGEGIYIEYDSPNNFIGENNITASGWIGIRIADGSHNSTITRNYITQTYITPAILVDEGSGYNIIEENDIVNNTVGFDITSYYNIIRRNNFINNTHVLSASGTNTIYHNNFINSTGARCFDEGSIWDNGYPSGGNYWSDYAGVDIKKGPNQDQPGSDGIGDTPYTFIYDSRDRYPLMYPFGSPPPPTCTLTITTTAGGTTNPQPGTYTYSKDQKVPVQAIPSTGYIFDHWELDSVNVGSQNPITVAMNANHNLKAYFTQTQAPYDVTIKAHCNTEGVDVSVPITMDGNPTGYYTPHTFTGLTGTHTFTVPSTDPNGHPFTKWNTGSTNPTITVTQNGTYTAYYGYTPVGGYVIPVDKIGLLAPYIGLASTTIIALTATIIYVKRFKHKKQKQ